MWNIYLTLNNYLFFYHLTTLCITHHPPVHNPHNPHNPAIPSLCITPLTLTISQTSLVNKPTNTSQTPSHQHSIHHHNRNIPQVTHQNFTISHYFLTSKHRQTAVWHSSFYCSLLHKHQISLAQHFTSHHSNGRLIVTLY